MMSRKTEWMFEYLWNLKIWDVNTVTSFCPRSFSCMKFSPSLSPPLFPPVSDRCFDHSNISFGGAEKNPDTALRLFSESKQISFKNDSMEGENYFNVVNTFPGIPGCYPSLVGEQSQLKTFTCKTFLYKRIHSDC